MMWPSVQAPDLAGHPISEKRFEAGELTLVPEGRDPCSVVCLCDRSHWLVTTKEEGGRVFLSLVCHYCRRRYDLPYVGPLPL